MNEREVPSGSDDGVPPVQPGHGAMLLNPGPVRGAFGRLFPAENWPLDDAVFDRLRDLSRFLTRDMGQSPLDSHIPAGYTYFGQFLDHDVTFMNTSRPARPSNGPGEAIPSFRTPRLDLDSLYDPAGVPGRPDAVPSEKYPRFEFKRNKDDVPREETGAVRTGADNNTWDERRALIPDPRNDENLIVAQLHVAFMKFHNKVVDLLEQRGCPADLLYMEARRLVRWHYQWIVVHDFLPRLIDEHILETTKATVLDGSPSPLLGNPEDPEACFVAGRAPKMPLEFTVAAFRFGHSMVRPDYKIREDNNLGEILVFNDQFPIQPDLRGSRVLPPELVVEWRRFFPLPSTAVGELQFARRIDIDLALSLGMLTDQSVASARFGLPKFPDTLGDEEEEAKLLKRLPYRNLLRGMVLSLPSAQSIAARLGVPLLTPDQLFPPETPHHAEMLAMFGAKTPIWYYILREARVQEPHHLGPVGGRLVAEVLLRLLQCDPTSYWNAGEGWTPTLPSVTPGKFTMPDLLTFAGIS